LLQQHLYNDKRETCRTPFERASCRALPCPDALIGGLMTYLKHENILMLGNIYGKLTKYAHLPLLLSIKIIMMNRLLALTLMQW
jgi:hypothetical protein